MRNSFSFACLGAIAVALAIILLGHDAAPVFAHPAGPYVPYTVNVEDEWGTTLRTFHKGGQTFVLGSYGQRYNIRVTNQTGARAEAVVTVDGRDVVSGHVGDFVGERGYVLEPYGSLVIEGFRKSSDEVAAFRFSTPGESYSSRMGTPQNVGVIGVAFFPERQHRITRPRPQPQPYVVHPYDDLSDARPAPRKSGSDLGTSYGAGAAANAPSSAPSAEAKRERSADARGGAYDGDRAYESEDAEESRNNLGTEYGETRDSHVEEVAFRRASDTRPAQVIVLRYDDEQGLLARGIRLHPPAPRPYSYYGSAPEPFPRNRFAPPPP